MAAEGRIFVDSKRFTGTEEVTSREWLVARKIAAGSARFIVRRLEEKGRPHPGCFLQEWQTKDLGLTRRARGANAGLKATAFSAKCRWLVRVAEKGVTGAVGSEQRRHGSNDEL
jgi:hypothetical protein